MPTGKRAIVNAAALLALIAAPLQAQQPRPGSLIANATGPTTVVLTWTVAGNATRYWVQRTVGSGNFANLSTPKITGTTHTDAGAPAGTSLRYRVMAGFTSGPYTYSNSISVTTPNGPASVASTPPSPPPGQPTTAAAAPPLATSTRLLPQGPSLRLAEAAPVAAVTGTRLTPAVAPSGPAPQNLRIQSQGPAAHRLSWDGPSDAWSYLVAFRNTAAEPFHTVSPYQVDPIFDHKALVNPGGQYRVTASYQDGREGTTDFVYASPPLPQVPSGFTVKRVGPNRVVLRWQAVPFAKTYRVFGTGQPQDGRIVIDTTTVLSDLPFGSNSWQVTADYGGVYATAGLPAVSVTLATNVVAEGTTHGPKRLSVRTFGGGGVQDWSWSSVPIASDYKLLRAVAQDSPTCLIPALAPTCGVFAEVENLYYRPDRLSARDRTATIGETYLYKVLAYNAAVPIGESPVVRIKIRPRPSGLTTEPWEWGDD